MAEDLYTEKLGGFKRSERPEVVLLLADNPELVRIIVAWMNLGVERTSKLTSLLGESESEVWEWLWENTRFDLNELKDGIGASYSGITLKNRLKSLVQNHIIYPDGTVNSFVERYLRDRVAKLFEAKSRSPGRKR